MECNMNLLIKSLTLPFLVLFSAHSVAVSVSDGVNANEVNDFTRAIKIWTQLANTGNMVAQYNLASHYVNGNGVQKNPSLAKQWLKDATHSGLVQAYLNLNKNAVTPANGTTLIFNVDPSLWLDKQEPQKYTIQLASSRYEKSIIKSYENNNINGNGGYYHYVRDGVDRYALIYGVYKTVADANVAMKNLPSDLRKKTPWVRKIESLQNISK